MTDVAESLNELGRVDRLKEGINIQELTEKFSTTFSLDPSSFDPTITEKESRIENVFEYEDFAPHVNLDCINLDSEDNFGSSPFDKLKKKMEPVPGHEKIFKRMLRHGSGEVIPSKCIAYCQYNSYFEMEEIPFDSSYLRSEKPIRLNIGNGELYPGFEISICTMKVEEKSQFLIDPSYAFGPLGVPPRIPPNATVLLEIELIKVVHCAAALEPEPDIEIEDRDHFSDIYKKAKAFHALGNDFFHEKNYHSALDNYKKAENCLLRAKMSNDEEEEQWKNLILKIYLNQCVIYIIPSMKSPEKVCVIGREAIINCGKLAHKSAKLFYCLGKANTTLCNFDKASVQLRKALSLAPQNKEINDALKQLNEQRKKYTAHEKITFQKMLGINAPKTSLMNQEPDDEFVTVFKEELEKFAKSSNHRLHIPEGLTPKELEACKSISEAMGLTFQDVMICGKRNTYVLK